MRGDYAAGGPGLVGLVSAPRPLHVTATLDETAGLVDAVFVIMKPEFLDFLLFRIME